MYKASDHKPRYSKMLGIGVKEKRTITCSCGWVGHNDFDVRIKPEFAQHKRDEKAKG